MPENREQQRRNTIGSIAAYLKDPISALHESLRKKEPKVKTIVIKMDEIGLDIRG